MQKNKLHFLNASVFFQSQIFMLPVLLLFYQHNGLSVGDFFLFQGIFSLTCLLLEVPAGYMGDLFPKRNILILSYSFFIARLILWLFFARYGYWIIFAGEILYALQKASFTGASDGYVYEYLQHRDASKTMLRRYGKMNSFMSIGTAFSSLVGAWCYHTVSEWSIAHNQQDYGFAVLIIMELILNLISVVLLLLLPKMPCPGRPKETLRSLYSDFFRIIVQTARNKLLRSHILLAGLLSATTMVFVWSFQPMMKILTIPVSVYGVIYFINHFCRAASSYELGTIMKYISLARLSVLSFSLFIIGFIITFAILSYQPLPLFLNIAYFCFLSLVIGIQLAFNLSNTSRIHHLITSDVRATVSSVNTAVGRLYSGFFLILLKFLADDFSTRGALAICFVIFLSGLWPLYRVYRISSRERTVS